MPKYEFINANGFKISAGKSAYEAAKRAGLQVLPIKPDVIKKAPEPQEVKQEVKEEIKSETKKETNGRRKKRTKRTK